MRLGSLVALLACNLLWSANPLLSKNVIQAIGPDQAGVLRYVSAWLCVLLFAPLLLRLSGSPLRRVPTYSEWKIILLIGVWTCFLTPLTQMHGIQSSGAITNSLMISLEPLLTVGLASLIIREKLTRRNFASLGLGFFGFLILSYRSLSTENSAQFRVGDFFLLIAITGEALYSVLTKRLSHTLPTPLTYLYSLTIGAGLLLAYTFIMPVSFNWSALQGTVLWSAIWVGPLGTAVTYLLWLKIMESNVPLSAMAATLFLQPFLGVLLAHVFGGEPLTAGALAGGAIILSGVALQLRPIRD